jgi:predicted ester cyclase
MTTPEEQNAATVRELIQRVMNEGDIGFAEKILSADYIERSPMPGSTADKEGAIAMFNMMRSQTPDMQIEIEEVIASGNKVAVHSTMTGTDTLGFMPGMSPTGKQFRLDAIDVFTFNDAGQNSEHYGVYDTMGAMAQLGLLELPAPPSGA